jgi:hypothetical protein
MDCRRILSLVYIMDTYNSPYIHFQFFENRFYVPVSFGQGTIFLHTPFNFYIFKKHYDILFFAERNFHYTFSFKQVPCYMQVSNVHVCMYICMYVCIYVCMYVRTYVRIYVCMYGVGL